MSAEIPKQSTLSIPRSLKAIGIIGGIWAILITVGAVIVYIPRRPESLLATGYLSGGKNEVDARWICNLFDSA